MILLSETDVSTSSGSSIEDEDFESALNENITVEPGATEAISIRILDDKIAEFDETFMVTLSGDDVGIDVITTMEVTISDNDGE